MRKTSQRESSITKKKIKKDHSETWQLLLPASFKDPLPLASTHFQNNLSLILLELSPFFFLGI